MDHEYAIHYEVIKQRRGEIFEVMRINANGQGWKVAAYLTVEAAEAVASALTAQVPQEQPD